MPRSHPPIHSRASVPFTHRLAHRFARFTAADIGGGSGTRFALLLAAVLALDAADHGAVGALAPSLKAQFSISNAELGLLASASTIVGAIATVPMGVLTDRVRRITLLTVGVLVWSAAMVGSAVAQGFAVLFGFRLLLGAFSAAAGPPVSSIAGDVYPADRRGKVLGWIRTGELVGIGSGFLLAAFVLLVASWREAFGLFAALGAMLAWWIGHSAEPSRSGTSELDAGAVPAGGEQRPNALRRLVDARHVPIARDALVDRARPSTSMVAGFRYVLHVRTILVVIVAGSLGDFFFSGVQLFAVVFAVGQYGISDAEAAFLIPILGLGALAGLLAGGRLGDELIARGVLTGRVHVAIWSFVLAPVAAIPVLVVHSPLVAAPFIVVSAMLITAPNPAIDAIRLDVIHPRFRGRAESVRTVSRLVAQGSAPLLFGWLADHLAGGGQAGLQAAFLLAMPALVASGLFLLVALRTYPSDVATVQASVLAARDPE
jgi:MFS family permease